MKFVNKYKLKIYHFWIYVLNVIQFSKYTRYMTYNSIITDSSLEQTVNKNSIWNGIKYRIIAKFFDTAYIFYVIYVA